MKELLEYDEAALKFYQGYTFGNAPLNCWDLAGTQFDSLCNSLSDLTAFNNLAKKNRWSSFKNLSKEIVDKGYVSVVTDANLKIVLTTQNMYDMNGYLTREVIGKSPKLFQGKETCIKTTHYIKEAIQKLESFEATILNYKKSGQPYHCWIQGYPIWNTNGEVVNFIAFEKEVA